MTDLLKKRKASLIQFLYVGIWPIIRNVFQFKVEGLDRIPENGPFLFVSNHNIGALLESHSTLFILKEKLPKGRFVYGFTHPSIFKISGIKHYFEWIGAVPATYKVADQVFREGHSLMIFPGGNRQALRSIWNYRDNHFRWSHGWAKIAIDHKVPVIPITFNGSHFVNPVIMSGEWVSKILIFVQEIFRSTKSFGQISFSK